jgi:hypothetical protein
MDTLAVADSAEIAIWSAEAARMTSSRDGAGLQTLDLPASDGEPPVADLH